MRRLQEWVDRHVITGGEAAYTLLLGTYTRKGIQYLSSSIRNDRDYWPIVLRAAYVDIVDTNGYSRAGQVVYLKTLIANTTDATLHLARGVTGIDGGLQWQGYAVSDYGVAVGIWGPFTATDTVFVRLLYHERSASYVG